MHAQDSRGISVDPGTCFYFRSIVACVHVGSVAPGLKATSYIGPLLLRLDMLQYITEATCAPVPIVNMDACYHRLRPCVTAEF